MISFPASPTVGQLSSQNGRSYSWSGYAWEIVASVAGHAATHGVAGADAVTAGDIGAAAASHTHSAADISAGTLSNSRLSAAVATYARVAGYDHAPASGVDVYPRGEAIVPAGMGGAIGYVYVTFFSPTETVTVTGITMTCGTTVAAGLTLARMGLYTFDGTTMTLVARTASDTTLFASINTNYQRSFSTVGGYPASYTLLAGMRYGVADIQAGGTVGAFLVGSSINVALQAQEPRMNAAVAAQADLPVTATGSAVAPIQAHHWSRLT